MIGKGGTADFSTSLRIQDLYSRMKDALSAISMTSEHRVVAGCSSNAYEVHIEKLRVKTLCVINRWKLCGVGEGNMLEGPFYYNGISTFTCFAERHTAHWLGKIIFRKDTLH